MRMTAVLAVPVSEYHQFHQTISSVTATTLEKLEVNDRHELRLTVETPHRQDSSTQRPFIDTVA